MAKFIDLVGMKFNLLTVLARADVSSRRTYWHCRCDCGRTSVVRADGLRSGQTTSCGCVGSSNLLRRTTHGLFGTRTYSCWQAMIGRCTLKSHKAFHAYGGAGRSVCARWMTFENFVCDMGQVPDGFSIDRLDNSKGYEPGNCRWADNATQARNKKSNVNIVYDGRTQILTDWANELQINVATLYHRVVRAKWPVERAFSERVHQRAGAP